MRIAPDLAALGADPGPLLAAQTLAIEARRAWQSGGPGAALGAELARYGEGVRLGDGALLCGLFAGAGGDGLATALDGVRRAVAALRGAPLAQLPWRHFTNGVLHSLTLAAAGRASLSFALIDGMAWAAARDPRQPRLASFQPGELAVRVVAGSASARIQRNRSDDPLRADVAEQRIELRPGTCYRLDGTREALAFDALGPMLLTLRLHRSSGATTPARQYDLASGNLLHQAAGERRDSRAEMVMALLRAMDRADAAPAIAALARDGEPSARWLALRECLALDSATGLAELVRVAAASGDPLTAPARALLDGLAARDPAFARAREMLTCPA